MGNEAGRKEPCRVLSLLPSLTEIVAAVGCGDLVVGITHECDHPEHLISKQLPVVTSSSIDSSKTSKEIDDQVSSSLLTDATMYKLDKELITRLDPNVILTQSLCDVCAVSTRECSRVLADRDDYRLVSIEPSTLEDVRNSIRIVGSELGAKEESIQGTLNNFDETREMIRAKVADKVGSKGGVLPTVAFLEWLDPLYNGGHWISEMMVDAGVDYKVPTIQHHHLSTRPLADPARPNFARAVLETGREEQKDVARGGGRRGPGLRHLLPLRLRPPESIRGGPRTPPQPKVVQRPSSC